jgi:hypothetical protein
MGISNDSNVPALQFPCSKHLTNLADMRSIDRLNPSLTCLIGLWIVDDFNSHLLQRSARDWFFMDVLRWS